MQLPYLVVADFQLSGHVPVSTVYTIYGIILHQLGKLLVEYLPRNRLVKSYNARSSGRRADNE